MQDVVPFDERPLFGEDGLKQELSSVPRWIYQSYVGWGQELLPGVYRNGPETTITLQELTMYIFINIHVADEATNSNTQPPSLDSGGR